MKAAIRNFSSGASISVHAAAPQMASRRARSVCQLRPKPLSGSATQRLLASSTTAWLGVLLLALSWCGQGAPDKDAKAEPATKAPAAAAAAAEAEIPQSVFVIPASPKEGRNPFFPHSTTAVVPVQKPKDAAVDTSAIVLNGITSKPFPSVMINGVTFVKGEEHDLRVPSGGKVKVRCDDIRQDSALVLVNGVLQRELRLRSGL